VLLAVRLGRVATVGPKSARGELAYRRCHLPHLAIPPLAGLRGETTERL